ncbi:MAG: hypothetical protein VYE47_11390 [Pseudomonadota bacterium]|nr:hypothetical protein [Pseudomonadota bacterium]
MQNILNLEAVTRVSSRSTHSAFTDLCAHPAGFLCCYRQAQNHMSADGSIEISLLTTAGDILQRQRLAITDVDLRDPKLAVDENNRFWLTAFSNLKQAKPVSACTTMLSWFSDDGYSWSSVHRFGESEWWIWRTQWHRGQAYGFAYNQPSEQLCLCVGHPNRQMHRVVKPVLSHQKHGLGYPNETALYIDNAGLMTALVRRDADSFSAQIGQSHFPYTRWNWQDLDEYVGGPDFIMLDKNYALVAGRNWTGSACHTQLWLLDISAVTLTKLFTLPSAGDNSYPGMVLDGNTL